MALSEIDRKLLERCLNRQVRSWEDFVDRFLGLVIHVIDHTAMSRSIRLTPEDREDLAAEVFLAIIDNDFAVLRHFRKQSSLSTYLTVVARRVVVRELLKKKSPAALSQEGTIPPNGSQGGAEERIEDREEVERLLETLNGTEAQIVRLFHLEGKNYRQISDTMGVPENSIGPTLTRARVKMRQKSEPV